MGGRRTSPCILSRAAKTRSRSSSRRVWRPFSTSIQRYEDMKIMTPAARRRARRPVIRRRIGRLHATDLSGTREQAAREKALAPELDRVGATLRAGARLASAHGAVGHARRKSSYIGEPAGLGNLSQRAGDCAARDCRGSLAALASAVAAAEPADR